MKAMESHCYSLARFEQPTDKRLYIGLFVADYIDRYQLFSNIEHYTEIIGLFMRLCAPPNVSFPGLDAICMFTTLSFFIDDQSKKGDTEHLKRYREVIKGLTTPQTKSERALYELLELVDSLSEFDRKQGDLFKQRFLDYIAAQAWERTHIRHAKRGFRLKEYYQYRPDAIALLPYLALLKLSEKIEDLSFHPLQKCQLLFLEQLATKIAYLDNDICSWEAERSEPTALNLVKVLKEERAISWNESLETVIKARDTTVALYVRNRDYALQTSDTLSLRRYLNVLECSMTGNLETMKRLKLHHLRYAPTELATA